MNEVQIAFDWWSLFPEMLLWRIYAFFIGLALVIHFWMMASYGSTKYPPLLKLMIYTSAFVGGYILSSAVIGGSDWSPKAALFATPLLAFLLWIWDKGFHVCDLVAKLMDKNESRVNPPA